MAGAELAEGRTAFEDNIQLEEPLLSEVVECIVLGDVEERGAGHAASTHMMASQVTGGDHRSGSNAS